MPRTNEHGLKKGWCGSALRLRRLAAKMTLLDTAQFLDSSISTVARWEEEMHSPPAKMIKRMAQLFDAKPEDFSRSPRIV